MIQVIQEKESQKKFKNGTKQYKRDNIMDYVLLKNLQDYGWSIEPPTSRKERKDELCLFDPDNKKTSWRVFLDCLYGLKSQVPTFWFQLEWNFYLLEKTIAIQWKYVQNRLYDYAPFVGKYMQIEETHKKSTKREWKPLTKAKSVTFMIF